MRYLLIILLLTIISACSCKKDTFKDDELSLKKQPYNGNQLRIDGYYYFEYGNHIITYFFYKNGVLLHPYAYTSISEFENTIAIENIAEGLKKRKESYGLFTIVNNNIKFEHWLAGFPHKISIQEGKILNDTTFNITKIYRLNGSGKENMNVIYHFKQFSPKPDSTNQFIP